MILPYAYRPLTAIEVFLPHSRLLGWAVQQNDFKPSRDIPTLAGKVIVVTGGNAGLGLETIFQLASHNPAKIYLAARSEDKANQALQELETRAKDGGFMLPMVSWIKLDLSSLDSIRDCANMILEQENRLDVLVLNAGIMATPTSRTVSGHDLQLGTNHLGHFLLTKLLLPLLETTAALSKIADTCVISVSSEAHHLAGENFLNLVEDHEQLCSSREYVRYGVSKAANILFASELARRYGSKNITSVSLHPGVILTNLYSPSRSSNIFMKLGIPTMASIAFDDVEHGALNQLWCIAKAGTHEIANGRYYTPVGKVRDSNLTTDEQSAARLWAWSEKQVDGMI